MRGEGRGTALMKKAGREGGTTVDADAQGWADDKTFRKGERYR